MKKILIVDDEPRIRDIVRAVLEMEVTLKDSEFRETDSLVKAKELINEFAPDLVISDINLSENRREGWRLRQWLGETHPMTPLILMSGGGLESRVRAATEGIPFLVKPFLDIGHIAAQVKAALGGYRLSKIVLFPLALFSDHSVKVAIFDAFDHRAILFSTDGGGGIIDFLKEERIDLIVADWFTDGGERDGRDLTEFLKLFSDLVRVPPAVFVGGDLARDEAQKAGLPFANKNNSEEIKKVIAEVMTSGKKGG